MAPLLPLPPICCLASGCGRDVLHSNPARLTWGFSWEVKMVESIKAVAAFLKAVGKGMFGLSVLLLFGFLLYAFIAA